MNNLHDIVIGVYMYIHLYRYMRHNSAKIGLFLKGGFYYLHALKLLYLHELHEAILTILLPVYYIVLDCMTVA